MIGQCTGVSGYYASPIFFTNNGIPVQPLTGTTGPSDDGTLYYASGTGCFPEFQIVLLASFDTSGNEHDYSAGNSKADGTFAINLGLAPSPAEMTLVASCGHRMDEAKGGITVLYNGSETPPPTPTPDPGKPTTTPTTAGSPGTGATVVTPAKPHFTG